MDFWRRKSIRSGGVLLLLTLAGALFLLRKEAYDLNRNIRLVCLRILEYEELSLHRKAELPREDTTKMNIRLSLQFFL